MSETFDIDRITIESKYHNPSEEFNAYDRMAYHGYDYDETTGLSDEEIDKGLSDLSETLEGLPHPIYKAKLVEYVLENTRIDINEHDFFVGMYSWNRLVSKYTVNRRNKEVYEQFPDSKTILDDFNRAGICYGWLDFDHTVPDWDSLMALGFRGVLERAEKCYANIEEPSESQKAFFEGLKIEYNAVINFLDRLYKYAVTKNFNKAQQIAACLKNLRDGAPTDTYEAMQLIYIYFLISESVDHYQVRSLGHGLDFTLYPFFINDIKNEKYTKEELAEFIGYFLMQWSAIGNYWGQPLYLGGMNPDGSTKVNELSYMILDVYDKIGIYNPKIQIKINKSTPKNFILKALEMIRHGTSSIVFCNDDIITKCLMSRGATYEEAVNSVISGCYEYKIKAKDIGISGTYFNTLKPVSLVLDNGFDTVTNSQVSIKTGETEQFDNFEKFYSAYLKQFEHTFNKWITAINELETKINEINPSLLFSGTCIDCVKKMKDALDCGLENTTDILISGVGTAVDALMAVYELVYENKIVSPADLKKALDNDWNGYEWLRARALLCKHKYGNNDAMADNYAASIVRFAHDLTAGKRNSHGGRYILEMHSARAFIVHGEKTKATPDGRKSGQETSKNASPTQGMDKNGVTALINSAAQIDTVLCNNGFCLDVMLHPSAVQGEDGLAAFYAVLDTYMKKGGASVQFNIFNAALLREAQENPDKYRNLQVRVCGWNVLWNNMNKAEQDAYILRAENIM